MALPLYQEVHEGISGRGLPDLHGRGDGTEQSQVYGGPAYVLSLLGLRTFVLPILRVSRLEPTPPFFLDSPCPQTLLPSTLTSLT